MADNNGASARRTRINQSDVPAMSLEQALRVPRAIFGEYAGKDVTPLQLATALDMSPNSGPFRTLTGASVAYGLTDGAYNAQVIKPTPLSSQIFRPLQEGRDVEARRKALLTPRVVGEFLKHYDGNALPRKDIALNVLEGMGVPRDRCEDVYALILEGAKAVSLIIEIKGKEYVQLAGTLSGTPAAAPEAPARLQAEMDDGDEETVETITEVAAPPPAQVENKRVFITHGKNRSLIEPIKKLVKYGELEAIVAVESASVSQPVPDKVMNDMRSCSAAIIHVDAERELTDQEGNVHKVLNENVLIEIGAAMALYGRRFILLVREGITLPSNLQGLYQVRYSADDLGAEKTIELLDAISKLKTEPIVKL